MSSALPQNGPVLVLDAASPIIFVGLWRDGAWLTTRSVEAAALDALFEAVEDCLDEADCHLSELAAFVYDEGPGSVLGIRVTAMALRSWKALPELKKTPVFAYRSLEMLAAQIAEGESVKVFRIIADYRKDAWLSLLVPDGEIDIVSHDAIEQGMPLYYLKQRKAWSKPPVGAIEVALELLAYPELLCGSEICRLVESPGVFTVRVVEYKRWEPSA